MDATADTHSVSRAMKLRRSEDGHQSDPNLMKDYAIDEASESTIYRKQTTVERETRKRALAAHEFMLGIPENGLPEVQSYIPPTLSGAIFCGHLVADLDSIAGAIGAAELYGGYPARASDINSETAFALQTWGAEKPEPVEDALSKYPDSGVCLVDHQQTSQLNKSIPVERIVGVIDHHALQNSTIVTDMPIYIDIRPWGSMSTIITHNFLLMKRRPSHKTAGMLLCAILSDTLNLQGPTTTEWDRLMVAVLVEICQVQDVQFLASQQFKAKSSELAGLTADVLVNGDQKAFTFKTDSFEGSVGFAVIETTDSAVLMGRRADLLDALLFDKEAKDLKMLYLAVVNIVELRSFLFAVSAAEVMLARVAFPQAVEMPLEAGATAGVTAGEGAGTAACRVFDLGSLVSRKKDFVPAITKAIVKGGFRWPVLGGDDKLGLEAQGKGVGGAAAATDAEKNARVA